MQWTFFNSEFVTDTYLPDMKQSPWAGHRAFAYDLVRYLQPKRFVELGTAQGTSFFTMCQAVLDGGFNTECTAVDTWAGDPQSGYYENDVFERVQSIRDEYCPQIATLARSTFDEALLRFEDKSIDLLHIDGLHTFEAVTHDYETWIPKLAENGVVMFHDIAVTRDDFGVYKLWDRLKRQFPHIEFSHSFGLGVLFPKGHHESFTDIINLSGIVSMLYRFHADSYSKSVDINYLVGQVTQWKKLAEQSNALLNQMVQSQKSAP